MLKSRPLTTLLLALVASLLFNGHALAGAKHKAYARLFGPAPMKGKATYEQQKKQGQTFKKFKVQVENAGAFQTYPVAVNGEVVGTLTTNAGGVGKLQLRTAAFIDEPGDGEPIPNGFPK